MQPSKLYGVGSNAFLLSNIVKEKIRLRPPDVALFTSWRNRFTIDLT